MRPCSRASRSLGVGQREPPDLQGVDFDEYPFRHYVMYGSRSSGDKPHSPFKLSSWNARNELRERDRCLRREALTKRCSLAMRMTMKRRPQGALARIDAWEGHHNRAERAYCDVLSQHPTDDDVRSGLFNVLIWSHRWTDARRLLDAAPHPNSPTMLGLRARLIYVDGNVVKPSGGIDITRGNTSGRHVLADARATAWFGE